MRLLYDSHENFISEIVDEINNSILQSMGILSPLAVDEGLNRNRVKDA